LLEDLETSVVREQSWKYRHSESKSTFQLWLSNILYKTCYIKYDRISFVIEYVLFI